MRSMMGNPLRGTSGYGTEYQTDAVIKSKKLQNRVPSADIKGGEWIGPTAIGSDSDDDGQVLHEVKH